MSKEGLGCSPNLPPRSVSDFSDAGIMAELEVQATVLPKTIEEIIYSEPNGNDIMDVFQWFKENGFGENWVVGNNERQFASTLVSFSQGKPTDFPVWNCIGFQWIKDTRGGFPFCNLRNNLDAAISIYYQDTIQEMCEMLSFIGTPQVSILLPSNEALDERVWRYRQPLEERQDVIAQAVAGINARFQDVRLPSNATVQAVRWDDFLKSRGAQKTAEEYSEEGEKRVKASPNFLKIRREAIKSGRKYLEQNGITNVTNDDLLAERQIMYYGVYAGEGVAYEELQASGRNIAVVNFEEMRVSQMAYLGSNANTVFVTPITWQQMQGFYQWEKQQIRKRK